MILAVSSNGTTVDVSRKLPVQPVKPVPPVFRSLQHPAAVYEPAVEPTPFQLAYGPARPRPQT